jgi:hypothetical protein
MGLVPKNILLCDNLFRRLRNSYVVVLAFFLEMVELTSINLNRKSS